MIARGLDHFLHAFLGPDIAGVDPQARRPRLRRFNGAAVVEMDIGHDRHIHFAHNFSQSRSRFLGRARHAHNINAGQFAPADLRNRRRCVLGGRIRHGLHGNRRIAAHRHAPDMDQAGFAALDLLIGTIGHATDPECWFYPVIMPWLSPRRKP